MISADVASSGGSPEVWPHAPIRPTPVAFGDAPEPTAPRDPLRLKLRGLLSRLYAHGPRFERRHDVRYPYPFLVELIPVDAACRPNGEPIVVVARDVSQRGIGFYHRHPLPNRRVILRIEEGPEKSLLVLVDLSWCRYTRLGWYENGGRFLNLIEQLDMPAGEPNQGA